MSDYEVMRRLLSAPPIAFHRELSVALGGVYEALFFQQIAYWSDKGRDPDGWIYKTTEELRQETTINRYQQDKARAALVKLGVLQAKRRGLPAKMHYKIEWAVLYALLDKPVCPPSTNCGDPVPKVDEPVRSRSANRRAQGRQPFIGAESTAKSTAETADPPGRAGPTDDPGPAPAGTPPPFTVVEVGLSSRQVWAAALAELARRGDVARTDIETWLRPSALVGREGDTLILGAPNAVARDRIQQRMMTPVHQALGATLGVALGLRVEVA